ncbi:hypothetical protein NDU88_005828 [Pleurodeles waltl]|uniref:Uncharacterized protein n=1 Tax=Pleurodeles waltl TaxID=8319 RepID=A0AAV7QG64_PLEWA|nr:hypothetical protein NDU88_005828 [Pleurodeles waltl]
MGPCSSPRGATPLRTISGRGAFSRRAVGFSQALPLAPLGSSQLHTPARELRGGIHLGVSRLSCVSLAQPGERLQVADSLRMYMLRLTLPFGSSHEQPDEW